MAAAKALAGAPGPGEALDHLVHLALPTFGDFAVVIVPGTINCT